MVNIAMAIDARLRPREPAPIDEARVIQLIAEDHITASADRGYDADIRKVTRTEDQRRFDVFQ